MGAVYFNNCRFTIHVLIEGKFGNRERVELPSFRHSQEHPMIHLFGALFRRAAAAGTVSEEKGID